VPFILPMRAMRLEDPRRLADSRYSAEPKLDGQRAQLHARDHRTLHVRVSVIVNTQIAR
jgi:ATP-dependent DNA ligase